ncbi:MAG: hypothetical protein ACX939_02640, partial [Hyphococcus sp.]
MTVDLSPPKPAIALRIGVTGHRKARLAADQLDRIKTQTRMVLDHAAAALEAAHGRYASEYSGAAPLRYFVSALADGADTLAAKEALDAGWLLLAPLPFSIESYKTDFSAEDNAEFERLIAAAHSVAELDGVRNGPVNEERAYHQAGIATVA